MRGVEMYRFQFALIVLNNIISFIFTSTRAVDPSDESFIFVYSLHLTGVCGVIKVKEYL